MVKLLAITVNCNIFFLPENLENTTKNNKERLSTWFE